jgi:hypothetical protein
MGGHWSIIVMNLHFTSKSRTQRKSSCDVWWGDRQPSVCIVWCRFYFYFSVLQFSLDNYSLVFVIADNSIWISALFTFWVYIDLKFGAGMQFLVFCRHLFLAVCGHPSLGVRGNDRQTRSRWYSPGMSCTKTVCWRTPTKAVHAD